MQERDVSNLSWKLSHCLKNNHSENYLIYQSERYSNVKEYVSTTMRMGSFINAEAQQKLQKNISSNKEGVKSMKSIKPKLGKDLEKLMINFEVKYSLNL